MYRLIFSAFILVSIYSCQPEKAKEPKSMALPIASIDTTTLRKYTMAQKYLQYFCSFKGRLNETPAPYLTELNIDVDQDSIQERMVLVGNGGEWTSYFLILKKEDGEWSLWHKDSVDNHYGEATFRVISKEPFLFELISDKMGGTGFYFVHRDFFQVQDDKVIPVLKLQESAGTNGILKNEISFTVNAGKNKNELEVKAKYYYYMCATLYQEQGMSDSLTWALAQMYCDEQEEIIILNDSIAVNYKFNTVEQIYAPTSHAAQLAFIQSEGLAEEYWLSQLVKTFRRELKAQAQKSSPEGRKNINWILKHAGSIR